MPCQVLLSPGAMRAFAEARIWLLQPGAGSRGRARWEALRDAPDVLAHHPLLGRESPEHPGWRQLVVSDHRLLYRVMLGTGHPAAPSHVLIVAVFGPGRR